MRIAAGAEGRQTKGFDHPDLPPAIYSSFIEG